jgi:squalene synthase HpnC
MPSHWLATDLEKYGPHAGAFERVSSAEAFAYCRSLARRHYENFVVGSLLLPRSIRPHFHSVYAYCRWADDLADEIEEPQRSLQLLDWWEQELDACLAGQATHPVFVALRETIREHDLPDQPLRDLLSAFRQDQRGTRYETFEDLLDYCRRSANPVGRLVLGLGDALTPENTKYSDFICSGLQLTNFWQDVARDYARGRLYLPREDLQRFECPEQTVSDGTATPAFRRLMRMQVERAERYLVAGSSLISRVPRWLRVDIDLMIRGGLAVIQAIRDADFDVLRRRPTVSKTKQLRLLAAAKWRQWRQTEAAARRPTRAN